MQITDENKGKNVENWIKISRENKKLMKSRKKNLKNDLKQWKKIFKKSSKKKLKFQNKPIKNHEKVNNCRKIP